MSNNSFTTENLYGDQAKAKAENPSRITTNYPADFFPIGLNHIDLGNQATFRLKAYADNVKPADEDFNSFKATIHLDTWHDTILNHAACSWLDVSKHSTDFQFGTYQSGGLVGGESKQEIPIPFPKPYSVAPKVIVWLNMIDIANNENTRIHAAAPVVTAEGFTLVVLTWLKTHVYDCKVSWVAIPSDRPNMTAGVQGSGIIPKPSNMVRKEVKFEKKFKSPPRVAAALSRIDSSNKSNLRLKVRVEDITNEGMMMVFETEGDSEIIGSDAGYVAIGEF